MGDCRQRLYSGFYSGISDIAVHLKDKLKCHQISLRHLEAFIL